MFKAKEGVVGWGWLGGQRLFEQFKKNCRIGTGTFFAPQKTLF